VAVFQDGVPLNLLANPRTNLCYLSVANIDRIEIYQGAASSAWGSPLRGDVNIITKETVSGKPISMDARASYGEFKTLKSRGTVSATLEGFRHLVFGTHDESSGFVDHTAYWQNSASAKFNVDLGEAIRFNVACFYDKGNNAAGQVYSVRSTIFSTPLIIAGTSGPCRTGGSKPG
jgi:outer membrane cobalamin receptor